MGYSHDLRETFLRPFICSAAMGIICYLAYSLTSKIIPINALCTLFAIMVAVIVYAVVLIISGTVTENELMSVPKGTMLIRLFKKVHLLNKYTENKSINTNSLTNENSEVEGYWIIAVDNKLNVYKKDKKTIMAETDIDISDFSLKEKNMLQNGVYYENAEELFKYLESNTS